MPAHLRVSDPCALLVPRALFARLPPIDPCRVVPVATEDVLAEPELFVHGQPDPTVHRGEVFFNPHWFGSIYARLRCADSAPVRYVPLGENDPLDPALAARLYAAGVPVTTSTDPERILAARVAGWDLERGAVLRGCRYAIGSPLPRLVAVGEWQPRASGYPFFSRSGVWLFRGFRELGHDETSVLVTNARGRSRTEPNPALAGIYAVLAARNPTWIALGEVAARELRKLGIPHVAVPHPSWHKRFRYHEDVQGYARRLREAGVPLGPYEAAAFDDAAREPLATVAVDEPPVLPDLVAPPADTHAYRPMPRASSRQLLHRGHAIDSAKLEQARRAFVQGEVPSIKAAARLVEVDAHRLARIAVGQEWEQERERYKDQVRESEYRQRADAEAAARVQVRQRFALGANLGAKQVTDIWLEAEKAAERVQAALGAGAVPDRLDVEAAQRRAKPREVLSFVQALAICDDAPTGTADEKVDRLRKLSLIELKKEFDRVIKRNYGEITEEADRAQAP